MNPSLLIVLIDKFIRGESPEPVETESRPSLADDSEKSSSHEENTLHDTSLQEPEPTDNVLHDTSLQAPEPTDNVLLSIDEKKSDEVTEAELLKFWFFE